MADIVTLDVGGVVYRTTRATLTRYPDSMLGAMFSGRHHVTTDDQGRCFIDRDGSLFGYVLNFLRDSELILPEDFKEFDKLRKEAAFYQLQPLIDVTEEAKQESRPERSKIEFLEMVKVSNTFRIRGQKLTIDMIIKRLPGVSQCGASSRSGLTQTNSDIIETPIAHGGSSCYASAQYLGIRTDSEMISSLHNVLFDIGFTLKSSILALHYQLGKHELWLFERS